MLDYAPHKIIGGSLILLIVNADADQHDRRLVATLASGRW